MGCVYHPNRTSIDICEQCEADLCKSCALKLEDGRILCNRCMVALSVVDVKVEAAKRKLDQESRELGLEKRWRPSYIEVVVTIGIILLFLNIGLYFHLDQPVQRRQIVLDPANPMDMFSNLQSALGRYAAANRDRYPISLFLLIPNYLADTGQNRRVLRYLVYRLDEAGGYVITVKENAPFTGKEYVVTPDDLLFRDDLR